MSIHPTAIIDPAAKSPSSCKIGPYCVIGPNVELGEECELISHVTIQGPAKIGARNKFFPFSSIGLAPQDLSYSGQPTRLEIGDDNVIREFVSIHTGTMQDRGVTRVGNANLLLAYVHIAHDCVVGSNTTFSNNAQLAGHVVIDDWVVMGGFSGVHQFCRVGTHAMVAAGAVVLQDVPPYVTASGYPATPHGTNNEGLRRRGFTTEQITAVRRAYRTLYREGHPLEESRARIAAQAATDDVVAPLAAFLEHTGRGIVR